MLRKRNYLVLILNLLVSFIVLGQTQFKQLSKAEKVADFNYLYQELEQSYPYFGINKRAHNTDWLSNKRDYLKKIKKTKNDKEFFKVFSGIMNDLNNGHTDAYPTLIYNYFYKGAKQAVAHDSIFKNYVRELEKTDSIRSKYWKEINLELFFPERKNKETNINETKTEISENVEVNFIDSLSTAIIHIKSFGYEYVEKDADTLKYLFDKAHNYKNLIIDIQGNDGGSDEYWMQNMIPHLINDTISAPVFYGFKNSDMLKKFKPFYFKNTIAYQEIGLPNMPKELKDGSYLFRKDDMVIPPSNKKKYTGNVYLLVDHEVFSSSEALAYFCKATNFATVVGEKTSGDGVGTDPLLLTLPNSGIVIRFTGEMGLNPDGSANDETKTVPDLIIKASNKKERRKKLINHIK
ncbi:tricorn protease-like protein [Aquimarina sp. MAR_2010_214]|uniref:S41 family peptidase n=1 Tax=Aquimarina sp. MAR_2010_214 TaxID=1250026 RepID=UPI000C7148EE|nr:S41 family peptidase [Aquimarina sp. MAR_2010_214]PKV52836.1 tricorn protease-like protein [Aquimarina sp. MAR_2010_214]